MNGKTVFVFNRVLLLVLIPALVAGLFFVVFFLSIVWTHRPDLTVREILREAVKETKGIRGNQKTEKYESREIRQKRSKTL